MAAEPRSESIFEDSVNLACATMGGRANRLVGGHSLE